LTFKINDDRSNCALITYMLDMIIFLDRVSVNVFNYELKSRLASRLISYGNL